ncbi:uncharacterized protein [Phyllobates terribilis]|uniref:uncharacterized protein isoform X1 n=1 Tax=Phyllobates terribilis TaxID=111132 RepID=UPI003CCB17BE
MEAPSGAVRRSRRTRPPEKLSPEGSTRNRRRLRSPSGDPVGGQQDGAVPARRAHPGRNPSSWPVGAARRGARPAPEVRAAPEITSAPEVTSTPEVTCAPNVRPPGTASLEPGFRAPAERRSRTAVGPHRPAATSGGRQIKERGAGRIGGSEEETAGATGDAPVGAPAGRTTTTPGRQASAGRRQSRDPLLTGSYGRCGREGAAGGDTALPGSVRFGSTDQARVSGYGSRRRPRAASRSIRRSGGRRESRRRQSAASVTVQDPPGDVEARGVGLERRTDTEASDSSGDRDRSGDRQDSGIPAGGDTAPAQLQLIIDGKDEEMFLDEPSIFADVSCRSEGIR